MLSSPFNSASAHHCSITTTVSLFKNGHRHARDTGDDDDDDDDAHTGIPGVRGSCPPASGSGSVGPFFGVLAAVLVLTALSCFFGRVCEAQAEGPDERYDCTRLTGRWRCWWPRVPRRPVRPAEEAKQPAALPPLPEP